MLLARAGLIDERNYLMRVATQISELEQRPAHEWQSAEDSSLDAWLEGNAFYRSRERSISYYNKGEIIGVLLDLRIREATNGRKSLRDLFHWMNEHYAKQHRYFPDSAGVQQAAEAVSGQSFAEFFRDYVAGVKPLPYDQFFQFAGLRVVHETMQVASAGFSTTANLGAQPEVTSVEPAGEAQRAGIVVGDRITFVNGKPADANLDMAISSMEPRSVVHLQLEGRGGKRAVDLKLGSRQDETYDLQDVPKVTPEQRAHRTAWVHGDDEPESAH
jgi:predicted metalloprotease with PDZ domain